MDDKPKRKDSLVLEEMDDDIMLADFTGSQIHTLNPTAAAIWEMCDGEHTLEQIAGELADHYGIGVEAVLQDVEKVVGDFSEKGLLE